MKEYKEKRRKINLEVRSPYGDIAAPYDNQGDDDDNEEHCFVQKGRKKRMHVERLWGHLT